MKAIYKTVEFAFLLLVSIILPAYTICALKFNDMSFGMIVCTILSVIVAVITIVIASYQIVTKSVDLKTIDDKVWVVGVVAFIYAFIIMCATTMILGLNNTINKPITVKNETTQLYKNDSDIDVSVNKSIASYYITFKKGTYVRQLDVDSDNVKTHGNSKAGNLTKVIAHTKIREQSLFGYGKEETKTTTYDVYYSTSDDAKAVDDLVNDIDESK